MGTAKRRAKRSAAVRFREMGVPAALLLMAIAATAPAKYSGGTGAPNDPYQIAADLIALGEMPEDYDKHFLLTADLDLDPNLPGRKLFDKAVIAPFTADRPRPRPPSAARPSTTAFAGVFDGGGHTISHLTIRGDNYLGLFGRSDSNAEVRNLSAVDVSVIGSGYYVGGLVGSNEGRVRACNVKGKVRGGFWVGGFVGDNSGVITACYAQGDVVGPTGAGGLVGLNRGTVATCYATGKPAGQENLGGLAGWDWYGTVANSFWDIQTSGLSDGADGMGKTTSQMQTAGTFLETGWDFVGETANGAEEIWWIEEGKDYPRLWWEAATE